MKTRTLTLSRSAFALIAAIIIAVPTPAPCQEATPASNESAPAPKPKTKPAKTKAASTTTSPATPAPKAKKATAVTTSNTADKTADKPAATKPDPTSAILNAEEKSAEIRGSRGGPKPSGSVPLNEDERKKLEEEVRRSRMTTEQVEKEKRMVRRTNPADELKNPTLKERQSIPQRF